MSLPLIAAESTEAASQQADVAAVEVAVDHITHPLTHQLAAAGVDAPALLVAGKGWCRGDEAGLKAAEQQGLTPQVPNVEGGGAHQPGLAASTHGGIAPGSAPPIAPIEWAAAGGEECWCRGNGISPGVKNFRGTLRRSQKQGEYPQVFRLLQRSAGISGELQGADFETRNTRRIFDFFRVASSPF